MIQNRALVSVILAVYNEQAVIRQTIESLMLQETTHIEIELLIIDGGSKDKTREIVAAMIRENNSTDIAIRLLDNPGRTAPAAFNTGIKEAKGSYVAILGAHCHYTPNYLQVCYNELNKHHAAGCSGLVFPMGNIDNWEQELCTVMLASSFAVSGNSFRTKQAGFADTIPYAVFKKSVFDTVGLYDEKLVRNQDNDMNQRIRAAGFKLYLTDQASCKYFGKNKLPALYKYASLIGLWNAKTLFYKRGAMNLRHFIPFIFLMAISVLLLLTIAAIVLQHKIIFYLAAGLFCVTLLPYMLLGIYFMLKEKFNYVKARLYFPIAVLGFHLSYGFGTLKGFFQPLK